MKITNFIVLICCLLFFSQCDKKEVVNQSQFNFPVIATLDPTVYAEIKKTSETHWDLSQMIDTSFKVDKNGVQYLIHCDGYLNEGYYNFTLRADENGKWIEGSKLIVLVKSYGYESWSNRDSIVKSKIEFPTHLISEYHLSLLPGYTSDSFTYKIALNNTDAEKSGSIKVKVFSGVVDTQLALASYLSGLTSAIPPRLTVQRYKVGDVAFGSAYGGILNLAFVRNNVLVIINAPLAAAMAIDLEIDKNIQSAPEWTADTEYPGFILLVSTSN